MRIEQVEDNFYILHGKMKEMTDYYDLKVLLEKRKQAGKVEVQFKIPQAKEINFFILGYLLKLARKDGFKFRFLIASPYLYESLHRFGLHIFFELENGS
ncbi:hypothetical protein [Helicobacter turcicus]|uniref:STAS domain-containing protein n=1 Tax=Helicobacter turcicus TaxID=2867412 RepID=A0ABS7JNW8_9HELI|nr:hypothetical protein [Helicobacter turcicus]MBX7491092.1 hypothetical protein [Helicobacter turcicus]MBX7545957.1 hypothetical protein [Helicobacter turcicus]